ncbi:vitamin K epoxide reductase family protein [Streptomyces phaeofaciens]|uniref:vitamin K epoxide reductase family protein n=1 Tax=Streptomyces phaeofaciens TaxID=68254 RepID=UPI00369C6663
MVLTGTVGWLASFQLTVDDWRLLRDPTYQPLCNISPVVSCGSVMSSPQGSLLGFPNMLLGLGAFAAVTALGVAVLSGARLHRRLWIALDTGALVGVVFAHWLSASSSSSTVQYSTSSSIPTGCRPVPAHHAGAPRAKTAKPSKSPDCGW